MTGKKAAAAHTRAKGKITNGKSGGRTAARSGDGVRRETEQKKALAKAAQNPRPGNDNPQPAAGGPAGAPDPDPGAKGGITRLKQEARNMVEKDVQQLLKGLKVKARKGSASDVKLLVDLARLMEQEPAAKVDDESRAECLRDLAAEPEYKELAEDGDNADGNSQRGEIQSASADGEKPVEIEHGMA